MYYIQILHKSKLICYLYDSTSDYGYTKTKMFNTANYFEAVQRINKELEFDKCNATHLSVHYTYKITKDN